MLIITVEKSSEDLWDVMPSSGVDRRRLFGRISCYVAGDIVPAVKALNVRKSM
jgi:hypothetical protein